MHNNYLKLYNSINDSKISNIKSRYNLPNFSEVSDVVKEIKKLVLFDFNKNIEDEADFIEHYKQTYSMLKHIVTKAFTFACEKKGEPMVSETEVTDICDNYFEGLTSIREYIEEDVKAGFDGDPAATSKELVVTTYPGVYAIVIYRIANLLFKLNVPIIPRMMTEYAHSRTGIDIHPGATIGHGFFIDHGTGVVIGETTVIGNNVKLYQGVTLGALSTAKGQLLMGVKRHPTIEDNVTIYSNASILGGNTVIGEGSTVGGNTFITSSVEKGGKVVKK